MDCDSSCWRRNTFLSCQGLVNKWWSSHISIDPNHQGTFCTFLVPWRLEQSLSIEYPMAYLRSFRTVGGWKTAGGTAVAKTCCNDCALKSSLCTPGCLTKLCIKHFTRFGRPGWLWCNGGVITAIGLAYKHHDILGFASLNLVGLLDW